MTLMINNDHVSQVLTMKDTIEVLEDAYRSLAVGEAVCRPRIDIQIPTSDPKKLINGVLWRVVKPEDILPFG